MNGVNISLIINQVDLSSQILSSLFLSAELEGFREKCCLTLEMKEITSKDLFVLSNNMKEVMSLTISNQPKKRKQFVVRRSWLKGMASTWKVEVC